MSLSYYHNVIRCMSGMHGLGIVNPEGVNRPIKILPSQSKSKLIPSIDCPPPPPKPGTGASIEVGFTPGLYHRTTTSWLNRGVNTQYPNPYCPYKPLTPSTAWGPRLFVRGYATKNSELGQLWLLIALFQYLTSQPGLFSPQWTNDNPKLTRGAAIRESG